MTHTFVNGFIWAGVLLAMIIATHYMADDSLWPVPHYEAVLGGPQGQP